MTVCLSTEMAFQQIHGVPLYVDNILKRRKKAADKEAEIRKAHWSDGLYASSEAMQLEPRIMLDGAAPAVVADVVDAESGNADIASNDSSDNGPDVTPIAENSKRNELVIVDTTVEGYEQLLADLIGEVDQLFWQTDEAGFESVVAEQDDRCLLYTSDAADE